MEEELALAAFKLHAGWCDEPAAPAFAAASPFQPADSSASRNPTAAGAPFGIPHIAWPDRRRTARTIPATSSASFACRATGPVAVVVAEWVPGCLENVGVS